MQNTNRYNSISQNNLLNVNSFRIWIKENLNHIYNNKKIPAPQLLIYLDYIKKSIQDKNPDDLKFWMDLIRKIEVDLTAIAEVEK